MPAETHQRSEAPAVGSVLDLLAAVVGGEAAEADDAGAISLAAVGVDDDLAILHLWSSVVEEFGERSIGDIELESAPPATLGQLAALFHEALIS